MSNQFLMKGKVYGERKHLLTYPLYAEFKYDEIRLHVRYDPRTEEVHFLSYAGKPLHNLHPWAEQFKAYMLATGIFDLDMGVLVNGNFNDSYRWVRSSTGFPKEKLDKATGKVAPALLPEMVLFYLFDVPYLGQQFPYDRRKGTIDSMAEVMTQGYLIPTRRPVRRELFDEAGLDAFFLYVRELGFEGLMVKTAAHLYVAGTGHRSDGWLKMKPEDTADGRVVRVNQAVSIHGEPLDRAGSITVLLEDGSEAQPAGIAHELGRAMWEDPQGYLGRWVEFKYMERDRQGGYRHPSFVRFREAKA